MPNTGAIVPKSVYKKERSENSITNAYRRIVRIVRIHVFMKIYFNRNLCTKVLRRTQEKRVNKRVQNGKEQVMTGLQEQR